MPATKDVDQGATSVSSRKQQRSRVSAQLLQAQRSLVETYARQGRQLPARLSYLLPLAQGARSTAAPQVSKKHSKSSSFASLASKSPPLLRELRKGKAPASPVTRLPSSPTAVPMAATQRVNTGTPPRKQSLRRGLTFQSPQSDRRSTRSVRPVSSDLLYSTVTGESAGLANAGFVDPMHALLDLTQYHACRLRRANLLQIPTFSAQPRPAKTSAGAGPSGFSAFAVPPVPEEESLHDS